MEEKIIQQLKLAKVRQMKNPTIVMNNVDFDNFKNELALKVIGLKVGENPTFNGIPIKIREYIQSGNVIIYDDIPLSKDIIF